MLLIIPAIEIKGGKCLRTVQGLDDPHVGDDPIAMAKLWRKENAKSLHVTDVDGYPSGAIVNGKVIKDLVQSVDIPIELGGSLAGFAEIEQALALGMYRVTINTSIVENEPLARECVAKFGASKIVLGIVIPATEIQ